MHKNNKTYYIIGTLLITIIVYSIIILILPGFDMDDFEIMAEISKNNSPLLYSNPINHYFISLRPISYLILRADYAMWGTNAIGMKLNGLILHLILVATFFNLLILLSRFLKNRIDLKVITVVTLIFSLNPESSIWIILINNQTELLGTLFYVLSLYYFLKYILNDPEKVYYLIFYLIFFCISIYSKQQALHLPLLLIFLLIVFRKKIDKKRYINAVLYACFGILVMILVSYVNLSTVVYKLSLMDLLKKPFSAIGILCYSIFPVYTEYIYYYALSNKSVALILFLALFIIIILSSSTQKKINVKFLILLLIGYCIVLYPRIYAGYIERINSIIILWALILLFIYLNEGQYRAYKKFLLLIYLLMILIGLSINLINYNNRTIDLEKQRQSLNNYIKNNPRQNNYYIACSFMQHLNPYEMYYSNYKSFGIDKRLIPLPISCFFISSTSIYNKDKPVINVSVINNKIIIDVPSSQFILRTDPMNKLYEDYEMILSNKIQRSFTKIEIDISKHPELNHAEIIYYDGKIWRNVFR